MLTNLSHRHLTGEGWTVAARTTVGGIGALLNVSAKTLTDTQSIFEAALPDLDTNLVAVIIAEDTNALRIDRLRDALGDMVSRRDPALITEVREVASVAATAEHNRSIRRVEQLASGAGVSVRTLQRLFDLHVGISPSFIIRRWRIIEAAESARDAIDHDREWQGWANVAAELGYADQAHLTRDFRTHIGTSPAAYLNQTTKPEDS